MPSLIERIGVGGPDNIADRLAARVFLSSPPCVSRVYEVEFSDDDGRTYASLALRADQLMRLPHEPSHQAA